MSLSALNRKVKMLGAYNTPEYLARFLVNWSVRNPSDSVIDPSCGDGVFIEAILDRLLFLGGDDSSLQQIAGVEIDSSVARKASERILNKFNAAPNIIINGFFETLPSLQMESYDVVVGNPPFVRYRDFFKSERDLALKFLREQGFRASKMVSAWVPFLFAGIRLLKPNGRLAMIMPAALFQVSYAAEVRQYLLNNFGFIFLVAFNNLVFPNVEQEIVLLMGTKGKGKGIRLIEIKDEKELNSLPYSRIPQIPVEDSKEKWVQYFLDDKQRRVLRKALANNSIKRLGQLCSIDVGIVTGANDFFVLPKAFAAKLKANEHLLPTVNRTRLLKGLIFTKKDWKKNTSNNHPGYLLTIKTNREFSTQLKEYITNGEKRNIHKRYKCKIRKNWYVVPSIWIPDAFLFRQIGLYPKMVLNSAEASCTDALHRVKFKEKKLGKSIICCFFSSLTFAFAEIFGRSYGGGVLELMPTEAEKLPIPTPKLDCKKLFLQMEKLIRDGLPNEAQELCDQRILNEELRFDKKDIVIIRSAWQDLSKRRQARKRRKK